MAQMLEYKYELIETEFKFIIDVYYDSRRPDLDNSLKVVLDCLQKAGAIKNDQKNI
jgi:Holliday junction resolvase RusA-like endonuclease